MQGLVGGVAGTQIGSALSQTADDWSAVKRPDGAPAVAEQGHLDYANVLFGGRESVAEIQQQTALYKAQMLQDFQAKLAEAKRGQADPAEQLSLQANLPGGVPEARGRIQANQQGQQYQPMGSDGKGLLGPDGQPVPAGPALTPQMAQILSRVTAGNAYGREHGAAGQGCGRHEHRQRRQLSCPGGLCQHRSEHGRADPACHEGRSADRRS